MTIKGNVNRLDSLKACQLDSLRWLCSAYLMDNNSYNSVVHVTWHKWSLHTHISLSILKHKGHRQSISVICYGGIHKIPYFAYFSLIYMESADLSVIHFSLYAWACACRPVLSSPYQLNWTTKDSGPPSSDLGHQDTQLGGLLGPPSCTILFAALPRMYIVHGALHATALFTFEHPW